jgi:hypothetical protein
VIIKYNQKILDFARQHVEEIVMTTNLFNPQNGVYLGEDFADETLIKESVKNRGLEQSTNFSRVCFYNLTS